MGYVYLGPWFSAANANPLLMPQYRCVSKKEDSQSGGRGPPWLMQDVISYVLVALIFVCTTGDPRDHDC